MRRALVNGLTLLNALGGLSAMAVLALGDELGPDRVVWAAVILLAAYVPDVLDGIAARALGVCSEIGAQLDVNADTVSFNVATALLVAVGPWALLGDDVLERPALLVATALSCAGYLCAGLWRSSRLVVLPPPPGPGRWFYGMTTNLASFLVGAGVLVFADLGAPAAVRAWVPVILAGLAAPAMVSRVLYPDVVAHLVQGRMPRWPAALLAGAALAVGPALPWGVFVVGCAALPVVRHLSPSGASRPRRTGG